MILDQPGQILDQILDQILGIVDGPHGCPNDASVCWQPAGQATAVTLAETARQTLSVDGEWIHTHRHSY